ncbi:MAG TPA: RES family NAD+ phosphorylase [Oligoflexus sp.]|uniref:RES family NAD+ phosphorylase n=1 Tax=Oligoflexus sp. TaxID=1971216 RepID=UPI002D80FBE5|nr:RES family NAD+ phosphorylase [Oligoflexus sp.]HET9239867.1 RES family NAD+ phosphorylase [Oligoflexus sp.]
MEPKELLEKTKDSRFSGPVFRAIFTSFPTKNLFADIGFREGDPDLEILKDLANRDSGIDFSKPQQEQPFQYGDLEIFLKGYISEVIDRDELLYPLKYAQYGRFSDGRYPVFYAALQEETALAEVAFHFLKDCEYEQNTTPSFIDKVVDKRVVRLDLDVPGVRDFRPFASEAAGLTADSYDFCQALGSLVHDQGIPMVLSTSARATGGTTAPIFKPNALPGQNAKTLRFYHFHYSKKTGLNIKKSDYHQTLYEPPLSWTFHLH